MNKMDKNICGQTQFGKSFQLHFENAFHANGNAVLPKVSAHFEYSLQERKFL